MCGTVSTLWKARPNWGRNYLLRIINFPHLLADFGHLSKEETQEKKKIGNRDNGVGTSVGTPSWVSSRTIKWQLWNRFWVVYPLFLKNRWRKIRVNRKGLPVFLSSPVRWPTRHEPFNWSLILRDEGITDPPAPTLSGAKTGVCP